MCNSASMKSTMRLEMKICRNTAIAILGYALSVAQNVSQKSKD